MVYEFLQHEQGRMVVYSLYASIVDYINWLWISHWQHYRSSAIATGLHAHVTVYADPASFITIPI